MSKHILGLLIVVSLLSSTCATSASVQQWILLGTDEEDTAWSYVLLAKERILIGTNVEVKSGDVGANSNGNDGVTLIIGENAKVSTSSRVKANYIWLKANSEVDDVYYNQIIKGPNATIRGNEYTPIDLPVSSFPFFPSFSAGTISIEVDVGQTHVLDEGDYGSILVKANAELVFSGGTYNLKDLTALENAKLLFDAPTEVRIEERLFIGPNCEVGPDEGVEIHASDIVFYVGGTDSLLSAVEGVDCIICANIYAPNGTVWLKTNAEAIGAFIGKNIKIGADVKVTFDSAFTYCAGGDKLGLYFYNDGVYAYFKETLASDPDPSSFTYTVYLDKPAGGIYPQDFRLVYSNGNARLENWNGSNWNYTDDITVALDMNSIVFNISLSSISNPNFMEDTNVWFVEYYGRNCYECEVDRAPNTGSYFISYAIIPDLPWPVPLVFIPSVAAAIYFIYRRRFERGGNGS